MGKSYDKKTLDVFLSDSMNDISTLYKQGYINYKGNVKDSNTPYIEYLAEYLNKSENYKIFGKIKNIDRESSYKVVHAKTGTKHSNRHEEIFARSLCGKKFDVIGKFIDYQIPLKGTMKDIAGKIDLISDNKKEVYLIEFKYGNNKESLLRSVLEIATYYQFLNKDKFKRDYMILQNVDIKKAVLISRETQAYSDFGRLKSLPQLSTLIRNLKVSIFLIIESNIVKAECD